MTIEVIIPTRFPLPRTIAKWAAEELGVDLAELCTSEIRGKPLARRGGGFTHRISRARQIAVTLMREYTSASYLEIQRELGMKSSASPQYQHRTARLRLCEQDDPEWLEAYARVRARVEREMHRGPRS